MIDKYIGANIEIKARTSLEEIIDVLSKIKDEMNAIGIELYSSLYQTQICLTSKKEDENEPSIR